MTEQNSSTGKACGKCGEYTPLVGFNKNKNRPDGLAWDCRECSKSRMAGIFNANKKEYQAKRRVDYEKNKDAYKSRAKEWAAQNPEKRKAIAKQYVKQNPEKRSETSRANRLQNPGMYAAHYKARQQRKRKAMPAWANEENIKAMYRQCAWVSKITGTKHHVDHFYPLKNSLVCGLHCEYNLRIIPAVVNLSKGNQLPME